MDKFETKRLTARKLDESDFEFLLKLHTDPKVYVTLGGVRDEAWINDYIIKNIADFEKNGHGVWFFKNKQYGETIGKGMLRKIEIGDIFETEVGYALMPEFWGLGFATEIAKKLVSLAFEHYNIAELVSITQPFNAASKRVMEKAGFIFEKNVLYTDLPHVLYRLKR